MKRKVLLGVGAVVAVVFIALAAFGGTTPAPVVASRPPSSMVTLPGHGGTSAKLAITRIAHSSVLVDFDGEIVLTDPWFTESSQYHHGEPLGVALADLPKLAAVVVSHGHYDHFDIDAFAAYPHKDVPMFVVTGLAERARKAGFTNVRELAPWASATVGAITITAAPAEHGTPEVTYVLQGNGRTVYFGGDTELIAALDELPRRFPNIDVALLPVNGLHAVGHAVVMSDAEAATFAGKLHTTVAIPIHYRFRGGWFTDTFILSYHGTAEGFARAATTSAPETNVRVLAPGERLELTTQ